VRLVATGGCDGGIPGPENVPICEKLAADNPRITTNKRIVSFIIDFLQYLPFRIRVP
jgi:hypothetical protein